MPIRITQTIETEFGVITITGIGESLSEAKKNQHKQELLVSNTELKQEVDHIRWLQKKLLNQ